MMACSWSVYLIFFELFLWELDVGCLWMSTKHLKDCNSGRFSLDLIWIDLEHYNFYYAIYYETLSTLSNYIIMMVYSQPQFVLKLILFLEGFQLQCSYKIALIKNSVFTWVKYRFFLKFLISSIFVKTLQQLYSVLTLIFS